MNAQQLLDRIQIASPCPAQWELMEGQGNVRFCLQCRKNVYNISEMTADEASDLIAKTQGHLCVRLFRRDDGTVLTQNCPVGAKLAWSKLKAIAASILVTFGGIGSVMGLGFMASRLRHQSVTAPPPPIQRTTGTMVMGDICVAPPTPVLPVPPPQATPAPSPTQENP